MPHIPNIEVAKQPTNLQEFIKTDELTWNVQTKSEFNISHDHILNTMPTFDTGQTIDKNVLVAELYSAPTRPIKLKEI